MKVQIFVTLLFALLLSATVSQTLPSYSDIVTQLNKARTNPKAWATLIATTYNTSFYGAAADILEAVNYMNNVTAMGVLTESPCLDVSSQTQSNFLIGGWGASPHTGCNNNTMSDRISSVAAWTLIGENVAGGVFSAEAATALWLIDSGIPSRGHRLNIMNPNYTFVGVGLSTQSIQMYSPTIVTDFAGAGLVCNNPCPAVPTINVQYMCNTGYYQIVNATSPPTTNTTTANTTTTNTTTTNTTTTNTTTSNTTTTNTSTASNTPGLPARADILAQINKARTNPTAWANLIATTYNTSFYGSASVIQAAVNAMNNATVLSAMNDAQGLDVSAQTQANYLIGVNGTSMNGCSNNTMGTRISSAGTWSGSASELMASGYPTAEAVVASWLIGSSQRKTILSSSYNYVGIGVSNTTLSGYTPTVVADFTTSFTCKSPCPAIPPTNVAYNCSTGTYQIVASS